MLTYLLIVWGGIVRVTGSGNGCGTSDQWPLCHGSLLPAWQINTLIEFTHRWIASLCTILVVVLTIAVWIWHRQRRNILVGTTIAAGLFVVQIALGALAVEFNLPGGVVMIHLANALLLFGVLIYVAVVACTTGTAGRSPSLEGALKPSVKWPVIIAVVATFLVAMSGAFVVETSSGVGCTSWPLCGSGFSLPAGQAATINIVHRLVAGVVVLLLGGLMAMILRRRRGDRGVRIGAMTVNLLLVLQVAAGALVVLLGMPAWVRGLHIALASLLWGHRGGRGGPEHASVRRRCSGGVGPAGRPVPAPGEGGVAVTVAVSLETPLPRRRASEVGARLSRPHEASGDPSPRGDRRRGDGDRRPRLARLAPRHAHGRRRLARRVGGQRDQLLVRSRHRSPDGRGRGPGHCPQAASSPTRP